MKTWRSLRLRGEKSPRLLGLLDLAADIFHQVYRGLAQDEYLFPRGFGGLLGDSHISKYLSRHRIALDVTIGKGGDVHILGFIGKFLADTVHPLVHQGGPRGLEETGASQRCRHRPQFLLLRG